MTEPAVPSSLESAATGLVARLQTHLSETGGDSLLRAARYEREIAAVAADLVTGVITLQEAQSANAALADTVASDLVSAGYQTYRHVVNAIRDGVGFLFQLAVA